MPQPQPSTRSAWPVGEGPVAALMRALDAPQCPLGPTPAWPPALRAVLDAILPADVQAALLWGPDYIALYNDAYAPTIGNKHPAALGRPGREVWSELWHDMEPLLASVRATGRTVTAKDRPFQIDRHGYLEQVYFDISYSAIRDPDSAAGDGVAGVLCLVAETTERVRAQAERAQALERIGLALDAGAVLGTWDWDVPADRFTADDRFARTFALDADALRQGLPLAQVAQSIHPDDLPRVQAAMADAMARGGRYRCEYRVPALLDWQSQGDGWRWIEATGRVTLGSNGQALRFPGLLVDCDARRRNEAARQELATVQEQLRLAQAAGGVGLFAIHIPSDTLTVSPEFCRLFGLPIAQRITTRDIEALALDDTLSRRASRADGSAPLEVRYRIRRADTGAVRWIARRAEYVPGPDGRPLLMRGAVQDVTAQQAAEAELRESETRFRALAEALPNQVWTADATGQLDWFNERVTRYGGRTPQATLGSGWADSVHPDDRARVGGAWRVALATGNPYNTEFRIRRHDGAYRWHLVRALPVPDANGVLRWVGTNTDIDDQKRNEAQLAELAATLEQRVAERTAERDRMWRLSRDLMVTLGMDSRVLSSNPAWQAVLGWSAAALQGRPLVDLIHPEDLPASLAALGGLAQGHAVEFHENRFQHQDGRWIPIGWSAVPDNQQIHAVGRDLSAQRNTEAALREAEERLRQSQKMETLGQLTGGIAHDFNNLLQGITGSLEVVRRRIAAGRTDDLDRFTGAAMQSARRAASLVHRLLAFARRQTLDVQPVGVNALVASMEELLARTLGEQIVLDVQLGADAGIARSDGNQLESAILNLALNARDAMPRGGRLTLATGSARVAAGDALHGDGVAPGDYARLQVIDTGTGMPPEVLAKVFEPFFTTKPIGQGTGLGLPMVYGFARQSGGHLQIGSEPGRGTCVTLLLPRPLAGDAPAGAAPAQPLAAALPRGRGEVVLVVEDDAGVRQLVLEVLQELGWRTRQAADGPAALPILASGERIDLLVSDVGLPGLNGRALAEQARVHRPALPVLFITGYAEHATVRDAFLGPGMDMLAKPFTVDALVAHVQAMLPKT